MMNIYSQQYSTRGDLAREQLRRRGYLYFGDVLNEVEDRLKKMNPETRKAFALGCAERLMQKHEALPLTEQQPFTLGWRPVIDKMWSGLAGNDEASANVDQALKAYYESPYDHNDGQDGPNDADEHAAAASIYAAECFSTGKPKPAYWAANRAMDWVDEIAYQKLNLDENDFIWDPNAEPMPMAKQAMLPVVQNELKRLLCDIDLLETQGITPDTLRHLKSPE